MFTRTIVIVTDNPLILAGLVSMLKDTTDFEIVGTAMDSITLTNQMAASKPDIVVICLDGSITPSLHDFISIIKASNSATKILALVSEHSSDAIRKSIFDGVNGVIPLNITSSILIKALHDISLYGLVLTENAASLLYKQLDNSTTTPISKLSQREITVLRKVASGKSNTDIARELNISCDTVRSHLKNMYEKLSINGRASLISFAIQLGILDKSEDV